MEALDGCLFESPIQPFNLTIDPWTIGFCRTMFEEFPSRLPISFLDQLCDGKLARPIMTPRDKLAFGGLDF